MRRKTPPPSPGSFWKGLKTRSFGRSILFLDEVGSTNDVALRLAGEGAPEGTVVTAGSQTAGRGRRGRSWTSAPGQALLFSLILRPKFPPQDWPKITLAAAVAVAKTCGSFGVKVDIKWPNDLLADGRKVCGILTEMGPKKDKMTPVVLGIGINLHQASGDFPRDLRAIATSLFLVSGRKVPGDAFFQRLLLELEKSYGWLEHKNSKRVIEEWRKASATLGCSVRVDQGHRVLEGEAVDIDPSGALLIRTEQGSLERVLSGDVEKVRTKGKKRIM